MATLKNDLSLHNLTFEDAIEMALDKPLWGLFSASGATHWWCMPNNDDDDVEHLMSISSDFLFLFLRTINWCIDWLTDWLIDWLIDWCIDWLIDWPSCLVLCVKVVERFSAERMSLVGVLCPLDMQLMEEVHEYLALEGIHDWSLGLAHLKALCNVYSFLCNTSINYVIHQMISVDNSFNKKWVFVLISLERWHLVTVGVIGDLRVKYVLSDMICKLFHMECALLTLMC